MKYLQSSFTMPPAEPNPEMCCEACVFGSGPHAEWCPFFNDLRHALAEFSAMRREVEEQGMKLAMDEMSALLRKHSDDQREQKRLAKVIADRASFVHRVALEPVEIPSDCVFCRPSEVGEFEALGYLPSGQPICVGCLEKGRHLSPYRFGGDKP
jgi:hypothetical protein